MLDAKERWQRLDGKRAVVLERARDCAKLTIPALLPPANADDNTPLPQPYQSLGARGVNNLAAKLLLALLPPGQAMFRLAVDGRVRDQFGDQATEVEQRLARLEQAVTRKIELSGQRPVLFEALTHLVTTGNVLLNIGRAGSRLFRMDQYVISRDPEGNPVEAVVKERVAPSTLPESVRAACNVLPDQKDTPVDVYTVIEWDDSKVREWQEINGILVPGSVGERPKKKSRWIPLRWRAVPGSDYGRGHVEEHLGDLRSLEGLSMAIVQFAAAASKILFGVRPGAVTNIEDIFRTESGGAFTGLPDDVFILQLEKYADFQVAKAVIDDLSLRLSHAFLLRTGTIRDAERVTAEEIRALAQELEDALGGIYTVLADEFQLPFVRLVIADMQQAGELPPLPEGVVEPIIVTGFQALGRNHTVNKLRMWIADLNANAPEARSAIRWNKVAKRLGTGYGVEDLDELIKSDEELAAEQQQQAVAALAEKAAAPVAGAVAKAAAN